MTAGNRRTLESLVHAIDEFVAGRSDLEEIQQQLQSSELLLERGSMNCAEDIRLAEADLEEIRFARILGEQRSAAVFRLDALRDVLLRKLNEPSSE